MRLMILLTQYMAKRLKTPHFRWFFGVVAMGLMLLAAVKLLAPPPPATPRPEPPVPIVHDAPLPLPTVTDRTDWLWEEKDVTPIPPPLTPDPSLSTPAAPVTDDVMSIIPPDGAAVLPAPEKPPVDKKLTPPLKKQPVAVPQGQKRRIVIIIDDVGPAYGLTLRALNLDGPLTLSFLPYGSSLQELVDKTKARGHGVMLHMPMEALGGDNPGPLGLLRGLSDAENTQRLATALSRFTGYEGINNHMGSAFTSDREKLRPVMERIKQTGLFFLDSKTSGRSVAYDLAVELGIKAYARDVFLDDTITTANIWAMLAKTEAIALRQGYAIAIGHPHPQTLAVLEQWLPEAKRRGFEFVPLVRLIDADEKAE